MMKASGNNPEEIGVRMKQARIFLGHSQEMLSTLLGGSKRGIQNNESGKSVPGGEVVAGFIGLGINPVWLLTGEGEMLLSDMQLRPAPSASPVDLDRPRFLLAIEAVEEGLSAAGRNMSAARKAELILGVYDMMADPVITKAHVLQLVKLAA